jgi:hypothetical protein
MPRLTKEEIARAAAVAWASMIEERKAEYPVQLMSVLQEATQPFNNYELRVIAGNFTLRERNKNEVIVLAPVYSYENFEYLQDLEYTLALAKESRSRKAIAEKFLKNALAKLTVEERKALGL